MYDNKKIFILGMARSGYEVAKFLSKHNCEILQYKTSGDVTGDLTSVVGYASGIFK